MAADVPPRYLFLMQTDVFTDRRTHGKTVPSELLKLRKLHRRRVIMVASLLKQFLGLDGNCSGTIDWNEFLTAESIKYMKKKRKVNSYYIHDEVTNSIICLPINVSSSGTFKLVLKNMANGLITTQNVCQENMKNVTPKQVNVRYTAKGLAFFSSMINMNLGI